MHTQTIEYMSVESPTRKIESKKNDLQHTKVTGYKPGGHYPSGNEMSKLGEAEVLNDAMT
jgi:hypothetical protein